MNVITNQQCNRFSNESLLLQNLLDHNTKLGFIKNNRVGLMRDVKEGRVAVYNSENGTDEQFELKFKKLS